jgi:hypothetical protein
MKPSIRELADAVRNGALDLVMGGLTDLPAEIGLLSDLRAIRISGTRLDRLPPQIGELSNLRVLNLSNNRLRWLPRELGQLSRLEVLAVDDNYLESVPAELGDLVRLDTLNLSGNRIRSLPAEIGDLINVRRVDLDNNLLNELPVQFGNLRNLEMLSLRGNLLRTIPAEIGHLLLARPELIINLAGNPLEDPIRSLAERGRDDLGRYLTTLSGAQPHYEAKVLLVGEGNVGKTSLVASLNGEQFVKGRPTTHGIEIRTLRRRILARTSRWRSGPGISAAKRSTG